MPSVCAARHQFITDYRRVRVWAIEEAVRLAEIQETVALVNGASVHRAGGGFFSGDRHALEESLCVMSSLFCSLRRAEQMTADRVHIPHNGVVVSPMVELFRHGVRTGYAFREDIVVLTAVISIAMFHDEPDFRASPTAKSTTEACHKNDSNMLARFRSIFLAACCSGAEVLVFPDLGCGTHQGDPVAIGHILGSVAREFDGVFREIVFCGTTEFVDHAMEHIDAEPGIT